MLGESGQTGYGGFSGSPATQLQRLRRTASNSLRNTYGGEVASVFLQHGSPFEKDRLLEEYSNRPFGRLFEALDRLGDRLKPMFDSVYDPFPAESMLPAKKKHGTANARLSRIKEIKRLLADGRKESEVAAIVGIHPSTVYRNRG